MLDPSDHLAPTSAREAAALARTAVAGARVATLVTYARHPSGQHTTTVDVRARPDGSVEVRLAPQSPAVRLLLARPLATVSLAPPGSPPVLLHGAARRVPGRSDDGRVVFHVEAAAVRVGEHCRPVDPSSYAACSPEAAGVLRHGAPEVLAHLNQAHADVLAQRLRADGHRVEFAYASHLDATGLTVLVVGRAGVETVLLAFPAPLAQAEHLPAALSGLLTRRCDCS